MKLNKYYEKKKNVDHFHLSFKHNPSISLLRKLLIIKNKNLPKTVT